MVPTGVPVSAKIAKLQKMGEASRIGGAGTVRRKKKVVSKASGAEDRRLQQNLKRFNVSPIGDIEEVDMFLADGNVITFQNPKVQASIPSNIYVVSGPNQTVPAGDKMATMGGGGPGAIDIEALKRLMAQAQAASAAKKDGDADIPDDIPTQNA